LRPLSFASARAVPRLPDRARGAERPPIGVSPLFFDCPDPMQDFFYFSLRLDGGIFGRRPGMARKERMG
jgi:hypothetical protein